MSEFIESWRRCLVNGLFPHFADRHLQALRHGLESNDQRLIRCSPAWASGALGFPGDWEQQTCQGSCLIGYAGWQADSLLSIGDVNKAYHDACKACNQNMDEPGGVRHFLHAWDEAEDFSEFKRKVLVEVKIEIHRREKSAKQA